MFVFMMCALFDDSNKANKPGAFLYWSGFLAIHTGVFLLIMSCVVYGIKAHDMRDPSYLDRVFENLPFKRGENEEQLSEEERLLIERDWYFKSRPCYLMAARRLKEVMEYWRLRELKARRDLGDKEKGRGDRWGPYIVQLRKSLDGRKWALRLTTDKIAQTPAGAERYFFVYTLCNDVSELEEDISRFWSEGWDI